MNDGELVYKRVDEMSCGSSVVALVQVHSPTVVTNKRLLFVWPTRRQLKAPINHASRLCTCFDILNQRQDLASGSM